MPKARSNQSGRRLIHTLNQRYRREFDRAERLAAELADIKGSRLWSLFDWLRRVRARFSMRPASTGSNRLNQPHPLVSSDTRVTASPAMPSHSDGRRPLVSIIIPFRDQAAVTRQCLRGLAKSWSRRHEVMLINNGSTEPETYRLLDACRSKRRFRIMTEPGPFNFSRLCNQGARLAAGEFLLFLNNDAEPATPDWLDQMLAAAARPRAGVVGALLLYPDWTIQHAGLSNPDGLWRHDRRGEPAEAVQGGVYPVPAVTGACLLIRRELFERLGGFDEHLPVTHNDVDLCRRVRAAGHEVLLAADARLFHYESLSRGYSR